MIKRGNKKEALLGTKIKCGAFSRVLWCCNMASQSDEAKGNGIKCVNQYME